MADGLRSLLGNAVDLFATGAKYTGGFMNPVLGAAAQRDYGISEAIAGGPTINTRGQSSSPAPTGPQASYENPDVLRQRQQQQQQTPPPGNKNTGGGLRSLAPQVAGAQTNVAEQNRSDQSALEAQYRSEQEARQREAIGASFDPVFAELDRQIGLLPDQRSQFENQVASLASQQEQDANTERERGITQLDQSKKEVEQGARSSLQNLEEDIRNQLLAQQFYFGARGAADSSAPLVASEAVARAGLKSRGQVLGAKGNALNQIELKKTDVNNLASDQLSKIDRWKGDKLFEVGQWYTNQLNQLNAEKANAGAERGKAIANLVSNLDQQFYGRLRQLDDAVSNYKTSVSTWQMQRAAELEDFKTKLGLSAAYSTADTSKAFTTANTIFNTVTRITGNADMGRQSALQATGVDPLGGYQLTDKDRQQIQQIIRNTPYANTGNSSEQETQTQGGILNAIASLYPFGTNK